MEERKRHMAEKDFANSETCRVLVKMLIDYFKKEQMSAREEKRLELVEEENGSEITRSLPG